MPNVTNHAYKRYSERADHDGERGILTAWYDGIDLSDHDCNLDGDEFRYDPDTEIVLVAKYDDGDLHLVTAIDAPTAKRPVREAIAIETGNFDYPA